MKVLTDWKNKTKHSHCSCLIVTKQPYFKEIVDSKYCVTKKNVTSQNTLYNALFITKSYNIYNIIRNSHVILDL